MTYVKDSCFLLFLSENVVSRKTFYKSHIEQQKALIKEVFSNQEMVRFWCSKVFFPIIHFCFML